MSIQDDINNKLKLLIENKISDKNKIDNLKFLKAELVRGKSKVVDDNYTIGELSKLYKSQNELSLMGDVSDEVRSSAEKLCRDIEDFLPLNVIFQLTASVSDIEDIIKHIDLTKLKNKNQIIGIIKKDFPYIDGNDILKVIKDLESVGFFNGVF